jgi:hypothetical protein
MSAEDLEVLKRDVAALVKRVSADDQTLEILRANITLAILTCQEANANVSFAVNQVNTASEAARGAVVRLGEIENDRLSIEHKQVSLRTAISAVLDYLDRVDPVPPSKLVKAK